MSAPRPPRARRLRRGTALALLVTLPGLAVMAVGDAADRAGSPRAGAASAAGGSLAPDAATATLPTAPAASVPAQAVSTPASVSSVQDRASGSARVVATADAAAVPSIALAAYQRAETVINAADPGCHLTWQLVAAVGRVESDHGRAGGSSLGAGGVARPGIFGPALDGTGGTRRIADTDAGQYDGDQRLDRAVGPLQFIPSTWSAIGVDADGDGIRDPQDIDDAALGAAVYLCSGDDDLSTEVGQRAAAYRYNNSAAYVDLVLGIMDSYLEGDFTASPGTTTTTTSAAGSAVGLPSDPGVVPVLARPSIRVLESRYVARTPGETDGDDEQPGPREGRGTATLVATYVPGDGSSPSRPGGPAGPEGRPVPAPEPFEPGTPPVDGGPVDGGPVDGGPVDGGPVDGGPVDGGPVTAEPPQPAPPAQPAPEQPEQPTTPAPEQPTAPAPPPAPETCTDEAAMAALGVTDLEPLTALLALEESAREAELVALEQADPAAGACLRGWVLSQLG
ncbi:lytic murein transglycosylase [Nocardioides nanhaiensis]|uniref:Transglycosylase SLT domain-containing protein n=1 Tax=Nocardioides nanhaiensis TaxID=1476871 RepID=A0ABP8X399_9ACTN